MGSGKIAGVVRAVWVSAAHQAARTATHLPRSAVGNWVCAARIGTTSVTRRGIRLAS
jgi:hypothetical protein